jgi:hypothetical protein
MKKNELITQVIVWIICIFLFKNNIFAQESQWEWRAGVTLAPQASWDFESTPSQVGAPLFLVTTLLHKKWAFTTFYNTSNNSQGLFVNYQLKKKDWLIWSTNKVI